MCGSAAATEGAGLLWLDAHEANEAGGGGGAIAAPRYDFRWLMRRGDARVRLQIEWMSNISEHNYSLNTTPHAEAAHREIRPARAHVEALEVGREDGDSAHGGRAGGAADQRSLRQKQTALQYCGYASFRLPVAFASCSCSPLPFLSPLSPQTTTRERRRTAPATRTASTALARGRRCASAAL